MAKVNLSKNRFGQTVILTGTKIHSHVCVTKIREVPGGVTAVYSIGKRNIAVRQQDWDTKVWKQI